jgi:hypothetical protein
LHLHFGQRKPCRPVFPSAAWCSISAARSWPNPFWSKGLSRFAPPIPLASALLIDNIAANTDAFRSAGGQAYQFVDDGRFAADLESDPLFSALL